MYADANIKILNNPFELANKYLAKHDFAMPKHFARDCIYEESKSVSYLANPNMTKQENRWTLTKKEAFPKTLD